MQKIKGYFQTVLASAFDFSFYQKLLTETFGKAALYLFLLLTILQLVNGIVLATNIAKNLPKVPDFVTNVKQTAQSFFPQELIVTLNNGKIHTNVDEPYYIEFPKQLQGQSNSMAKHLITIDTKAAVSDFIKYNTIILITKDSVVYPDKQAGYRVQPLSESKENIQIDRRSYDLLLGKLLPYLRYVPVGLYSLMGLSVVVLPWIVGLFVLGSKMTYLLFMTLILLIIAKLMKKNLGYGQIYKLSLHGLTIPIVISFIADLFNYTLPTLSYTAIFILIMVVVFSRLNVVHLTKSKS